VLASTVRELAVHLPAEFGDHYALARELEIVSKLAWRGPDAVRAAAAGAQPRRGSRAAGPAPPLDTGES